MSPNNEEMDNMHVEFSCEPRMSPSILMLPEIVLSSYKALLVYVKNSMAGI